MIPFFLAWPRGGPWWCFEWVTLATDLLVSLYMIICTKIVCNVANTLFSFFLNSFQPSSVSYLNTFYYFLISECRGVSKTTILVTDQIDWVNKKMIKLTTLSTASSGYLGREPQTKRWIYIWWRIQSNGVLKEAQVN